MSENWRGDLDTMPIGTELLGTADLGYGGLHGTFTDTQAEEYLKQAGLQLVEYPTDTPGSCIDGRRGIRTLSGEPCQPRPSLAGGEAVSGYSAILVAHPILPGKGDHLTGLKNTIRSLETVSEDEPVGQERPRVGAHISLNTVGAFEAWLEDPDDEELQSAINDPDCAAISKFTATHGNMSRVPQQLKDGDGNVIGLENEQQVADRLHFLEVATQLQLGDAYDEMIANELFDKNTRLVGSNYLDSWRPIFPYLAMYDVLGEEEMRRRVEVLDADHGPGHKHKEGVVEFVDASSRRTVPRDHLIDETGLEAFKVDVRRAAAVARKLATGPDSSELLELKLQHAVAMFQAGTLVTVGDGSHYLGRLTA